MESRVVLVTGGAQGLGAATAVALAARGCSVAVVDVNEAGARRIVESCEQAKSPKSPAAKAIAVVTDLATAEGPGHMVDETVRRLERIDVLINCAAYAPVESFLEMTAGSWEAALLINVRAVALAMSAAGRAMTRQKSGHIINVTSAAARMSAPHFAAYAATKAATDVLTRTGAAALGPYGVRVNSFSPGMMETPMQESIEAKFCKLEGRTDLDAYKAERTARVPLKRRTGPDEMAESLVWLALDSPPYMTAERLNVSGGLDKD